jgi:hypothetical protein
MRLCALYETITQQHTQGSTDASFAFGLQQMHSCLQELKTVSEQLQSTGATASFEDIAAQLKHFKQA